MTAALAFHDITFQPVEHRTGETWLRVHEISEALGYADPRSVGNLYNANATEFTDSMTALVRLPTAGGVQEVRIFSLRGAHLLGMFARTERAAEFRRWVLDVLDRQATGAPAGSDAAERIEHMRSQIHMLRMMVAPNLDDGFRRKMKAMLRLHAIQGLSQEERAKLMGWSGGADAWRQELRKLDALGLVDYVPDPQRVKQGKMGYAKALSKMSETRNRGANAEHMAKMRARLAQVEAERTQQRAIDLARLIDGPEAQP